MAMAESGFRLNAKEFKEIIKSVMAFSDSIGGNFSLAATFTVDPPALRLTSELSTLEVRLATVEVLTGGPKHFHFQMEPLVKLAFTGAQVEVTWKDLKMMRIKCGSFKADLNIAASTHSSVQWPQPASVVQLPYGVVAEICKYAKLPHSYVVLDKLNTAVELTTEGSSFVASSEDSFSFIRYSFVCANLQQSSAVKVPYFAIQSINSKHIKDGDIVIGSSGNACLIGTPAHTLCIAGLNDQLNPWSTAINSMGKPSLTTQVDSDDLVDALKPLYAMIPSKEKSSAMIVLTVAEGGLQMELSQPGVSTATSHVPCAVAGSGKINLHPQAFHDFTSMLSGLGTIEISASSVATKLLAKTKLGTIEYLLTNVIL